MERTFAVENSSRAQSVEPTTDGGYVIVGSAKGTYNDDAVILKTDNNGYEVWRKIIGENDYTWQGETGSSVLQPYEHVYILAGSKATDKTFWSSAGDLPIFSVYLVKIEQDTMETIHTSSDSSSKGCFINTLSLSFLQEKIASVVEKAKKIKKR